MDLWSKLRDWLKQNPWWGALGFLVGLLSIIIAIILFMIGRHTKEPIYAIQSANLIQDFTGRFDSLEITYARERISNLTATKVAFWNNGKDTINSGDIASADPLMIRVKNGYKILDSSVLHSKEVSNQFKIIPSKDGLHVLIQFDYLDKGEGGVVQLLHTGKSSDDVEVCGTIKGAGKPKLRTVKEKYTPPIFLLVGNGVFTFLVGILIYIYVYVIKTPINFLRKVELSLLIILTFFCWGLWIDTIFTRYVPRGFEIFYEEFSNSLK